MAEAPLSSQLYLSKDATRAKVIEFLQDYMELANVDLTKTSFLSFVVDIISTLTTNLMFYQSSVYKEFFLTKAQLPESIYNLSAFLGYRPTEASYASANLLITIPFGFTDPSTTITFADGSEFTTTDGLTFSTYYTTTITVTGNSTVSIKANVDGKIYNIPVEIGTSQFQFILPVRQYKETIQEFQLDEDLQPFQYSTLDITVDGKLAGDTDSDGEQTSGMEVYVQDPDGSSQKLYTEYDSLYLMTASDFGYVQRLSQNGRTIYFGNGITGKQPLAGSTVFVHLKITEGSDGNAIAGSITNGPRIYTLQNGITTILDYTATNPSAASGGDDEQSLQEIRTSAINSLTTLHRLVSENDYNVASTVFTNAPIATKSFPVLKRSDLKANEIQLFTTLEFGSTIVPTRNAYHTISTDTLYISRGTVVDQDGDDYITLFDMSIDKVNTVAYYNYVITEIVVSPTLSENWIENNEYDLTMNDLTITRS